MGAAVSRSDARRDLLWAAVTGLHRGVFGGVAMLGWFLLASTLLQQPTWTVPNLLAMVVNQDMVLRRGFGWASLVGVALVVSLAGLCGAAFGLATSRLRSRRRLLLLGILAGLVTYYIANTLFYRWFGAIAWIYASPRMLLVAHLLFGVLIGYRSPAAVEPADTAAPAAPS